jgi:hypothetical protein
VGAIILTTGLIVSNHQAVELGRGYAAISRGGYEASGDPTPFPRRGSVEAVPHCQVGPCLPGSRVRAPNHRQLATMTIGLDPWWEEPEYREASVTFRLRGLFIFDKLRQHDAARFAEVMADLYRDEVPDPQDIGAFEWQTILAFMGASEAEIKDVQKRMGRRWRAQQT